MNANEYLDEVEKRAEAATKGPWFAHPAGKYVYDRPNGQIIDGCVENTDINAVANMAFTAASRTDVPKMAKALRAVLWVHRPRDSGRVMNCCSCEDFVEANDDLVCVEYPCPTIRAITKALEGEE